MPSIPREFRYALKFYPNPDLPGLVRNLARKYPGVRVVPAGPKVDALAPVDVSLDGPVPTVLIAPTNVAWGVEADLRAWGIDFEVTSTPKKLEAKADESILTQAIAHGLHSWVIDFMTPYQRAGVVFAENAPEGSAILWYPTGSGKTLTATAWALVSEKPCLFVTKAGARQTIFEEVTKYTSIRPLVLLPEGERSLKTIQRMFPDAELKRASEAKAFYEDRVLRMFSEPPKMAIVGWETLKTFSSALDAYNYESIIFDELHFGADYKRFRAVPALSADGESQVSFQSRENRSTQAAHRARKASRRLGITATLIPDRRRGLWSQLDLIHPGAWGMSPWTWFGRYCDLRPGQFGQLDNSGKSNDRELAKRMSFGVQRLDYKVTHAQLPSKRRRIVTLSKAEQTAPAAFRRELKRAQASDAKSLIEVRIAEAASRKRGYILDLVSEDIASNHKVIVFTARKADCDRWQAAFTSVLKGVKIWSAHGDTPVSIRDQIRDEYMAHPGPCVLLGTAAAWGECMTPETLVLGEDKSIGDYEAGDLVLGSTGKVWCRGQKTKAFSGHLVSVRGIGLLPIEATPNHPVLVLEGSLVRGRGRHFEFRGPPVWKRIDALRPWKAHYEKAGAASGDFLLIPRLPGVDSTESFDLNAYTKGSNSQAGRATRGYTSTIPLTPDFAWLLGLYVAEGSASPRSAKGNGWRAFFSLHQGETEIVERIRRTLQPLGLKATVHALKGTKGINVIVRSGPLARLLMALAGKGAHHKRIPAQILHHKNLDVLKAFLEGYVAGDGHVGPRNTTCGTVSKVLALHLQLACARLGKLALVTPRVNKVRMIRGRPVRACAWFMVRWPRGAQRHSRHRVLPDYIATPLAHVSTRPYEGPVVDIGTTDQTFLASNAVVHNSFNLQDTDHMIFAMLPLNVRQAMQWEGRAHRLGSKRPVLYTWVVAEGTYDEHIRAILLEKLPSVTAIADDSESRGMLEDARGQEEDIEKKLLEGILGFDPDLGESF